MKTDRHSLPPGLLPRLLTADQAAQYCGVSAETLRAKARMARVNVFGRRELYDRAAIDHWLNEQAGLNGPPEDGTVDWKEALKPHC